MIILKWILEKFGVKLGTLAQNRFQWKSFVNTVTNFGFYKSNKFLDHLRDYKPFTEDREQWRWIDICNLDYLFGKTEINNLAAERNILF